MDRPPLHLEHCSGRYEVTLEKLDCSLLEPLRQLPRQWMISIRLRLASGFASAAESLAAIGFIFIGIAPNERCAGWLARFHRGYRAQTLKLHCPHIQRLHDQAQQHIALRAVEAP